LEIPDIFWKEQAWLTTHFSFVPFHSIAQAMPPHDLTPMLCSMNFADNFWVS
jgi:hypothetical protein